jgi:hypothetical protein
MHLAGPDQKQHIFRLNRLDGGFVETSLRYSDSRAICHAIDARSRTAAKPGLAPG